jgi:hypothetical protein
MGVALDVVCEYSLDKGDRETPEYEEFFIEYVDAVGKSGAEIAFAKLLCQVCENEAPKDLQKILIDKIREARF